MFTPICQGSGRDRSLTEDAFACRPSFQSSLTAVIVCPRLPACCSASFTLPTNSFEKLQICGQGSKSFYQ